MDLTAARQVIELSLMFYAAFALLVLYALAALTYFGLKRFTETRRHYSLTRKLERLLRETEGPLL